MNYFFDSYAIIELLKSNPAYARFKDEPMVTSAANLGEVYYYHLRVRAVPEYHEFLLRTQPTLLETTARAWEEAALLKFAHRQENASLIDCLGYELARANHLRFLTGDPPFEQLPNVEFVR